MWEGSSGFYQAVAICACYYYPTHDPDPTTHSPLLLSTHPNQVDSLDAKDVHPVDGRYTTNLTFPVAGTSVSVWSKIDQLGLLTNAFHPLATYLVIDGPVNTFGAGGADGGTSANPIFDGGENGGIGMDKPAPPPVLKARTVTLSEHTAAEWEQEGRAAGVIDGSASVDLEGDTLAPLPSILPPPAFPQFDSVSSAGSWLPAGRGSTDHLSLDLDSVDLSTITDLNAADGVELDLL